VGLVAGAPCSEPRYRCPIVIVQADDFNQSGIRTVLAVALTTNLRLAEAPGNFLLPRQETVWGASLPPCSVGWRRAFVWS
jgi:mRNA-degrading endonuclease toxin of MazEF toxin-antitoxin module